MMLGFVFSGYGAVEGFDGLVKGLLCLGGLVPRGWCMLFAPAVCLVFP